MATSIRVILERDARGEYEEWLDFDEALWDAVCDLINTPEDLASLPEPVGAYYATRLLELDVGNGGFAQAASNYPEWFGPAAKGFDAMGMSRLAAFVREAAALVEAESERIAQAKSKGLEGEFEYFREGVFDDFDDKLDEVGWWCDLERLEYVRRHRDAFAQVDA